MEARLIQDNVNMFDPRSVGRVTWYWSNGQYRVTQPNIDRMEAVEASDYDRLLTLAEDKDSTIATLRADASKAAAEARNNENAFFLQVVLPQLGCKVEVKGDATLYTNTLAESLRRERERHQWIDCKQELPEYGQLCILFGGGVVQHALYSLDAESGSWQPFDEDFDPAPFSTFTHWQPLPKPPALLEPQPAPVATGEEK